MKFSLNIAILAGNVSNYPELRYTPTGKPVCKFNVATSRSIKKGEGEYENVPTFHRIVCWNKLAEFCSERLSKGNAVTIEGRIENRSWEYNGEKKYMTEIIADSVIFRNSKIQANKTNEDKVDPRPKEDTSDINNDPENDTTIDPSQEVSPEEIPF